MTPPGSDSLCDPPPAARRGALAVLLCVAALGGAMVLLYATRLGIGLWGDSMDYIAAAKSISAGAGIRTIGELGAWEPLRIFPPLYPMLLSLSRLFHTDPITGARYLHAILFGGTLALAGGMAWSATRSLVATGAICAVAFATLLEVFAKAQSEPAFIFFLFAGLLLLASHLRRPSILMLILSALAVGAAILTRYAGAVLLVVGAIALLMPGTKAARPLSKRLGDAALFLALAAAPIAIWVIHLGSAEKATGREAMFHPPDADRFLQALRTFGSWVVALKSPTAVALLGAIFLAGSVIYATWRLAPQERRRALLAEPLLLLLLLFVVLYLPFLILSISFFDASTNLNSRILSPMIVPLFVLLLAMLCQQVGLGRPVNRPPGGHRWASASCVLIALLIAASIYKLYHVKAYAKAAHRHGIEYTYSSLPWRDSLILKRIALLPPKTMIYTNAKDVLYLLANRVGRTIPQTELRKKHADIGSGNERRSMLAMRRHLRSSEGFLIYFDGVDRTDFLAQPDLIRQWMPLELVEEIKDPSSPEGSGRIYRVPPPPPDPADAPTTRPATRPAAPIGTQDD